MAIIKACIIGNSLKNSGKECDIAMGATAMIIAVPPSIVITAANLADPIAWIKPLMHASKQLRVYPFFGVNAAISVITNDAEGDVTVTLDDGLKVLVRRGVYNRTFETIAGGLCYADALFGLTASGYRLIEIDQIGQMLLHKIPKTDAGVRTWSGLITSFMAGLAPTIATLKDIYRNRFSYSFTPEELVFNGEIFTGASSLLSLIGLINTEIAKGVTVQTTTHLFVKVQTECAESNLLTLLGVAGDNPLEDATNFIITNKATGVVVVATDADIVGGEMQLTGVFVSGQTYHVVGSAPSVWFDNDIEGYDASENGVDILIP